ncbi:MAG: sulfotransferase domain-containing protein [Pseudolabrys sp.]|nr:sulfotransferase domain-containing protein [Pseudolabrys sp.]
MRTIWLASYPKSGNTWFRMLLANLASDSDTPADINELPRRGHIASSREPFDHVTLLDSGLLTDDEIDSLRPLVHAELAQGNLDDEDNIDTEAPPVHFIKTHDAYTRTVTGEPLLAGRLGADGAILIVRDPRDVASSWANHQSCSLDDAITFMNSNNAEMSGGRRDRIFNQFRQILPGWSGYIESWLEQRDIPIHLVRYEDMKADTAMSLARALAFARYDVSLDAIKRAVRLADFTELQRQERAKGFREAPRAQRDGNFFRRGEAGAWREELTPEQVARIENEHAPMMRRLGYVPVTSGKRAISG